jgi:hypothetical protein
MSAIHQHTIADMPLVPNGCCTPVAHATHWWVWLALAAGLAIVAVYAATAASRAR